MESILQRRVVAQAPQPAARRGVRRPMKDWFIPSLLLGIAVVFAGINIVDLSRRTDALEKDIHQHGRAQFMLDCVNSGYKTETCHAAWDGAELPEWPDAEPDY
jgi:hypothetical protein